MQNNDKKFLQATGRFPLTRAEKGAQQDTENGIIQLMKAEGIEINRENYLYLSFCGTPPAEIDGELEAELPEYLREEEDEKPHDLTTEQLGEEARKTIQSWSPQEKAAFRERLDKSLGFRSSKDEGAMRTEYDKLREQLPWTNEELRRVLDAHNFAYGVDGKGDPWPSLGLLATLIELHRPSNPNQNSKPVGTCKHCGRPIQLTGYNGRTVWEHTPHHGPYPNTHCKWGDEDHCCTESCTHADPKVGMGGESDDKFD